MVLDRKSAFARRNLQRLSPTSLYRKGRSLKDVLVRAKLWRSYILPNSTNRSRDWPVTFILHTLHEGFVNNYLFKLFFILIRCFYLFYFFYIFWIPTTSTHDPRPTTVSHTRSPTDTPKEAVNQTSKSTSMVKIHVRFALWCCQALINL